MIENDVYLLGPNPMSNMSVLSMFRRNVKKTFVCTEKFLRSVYLGSFM